MSSDQHRDSPPPGVRLSIVTTLYKSAGTIGEFHGRVSEAAREITGDYEIVFVDDGSPDDSLALVCRIAESDPKVRVIELSRNFGHHRAMMTGLDHSRGDLVFLIDCDLEEAPELLLEFHANLAEQDADVVYGFQNARKGGFVERVTGAFSYWLINRLIPISIPRNHITVRLMRRDYVRSLLLHREHQTIIGGLWVITGYRQLGIPVAKGSREGTTYSMRRRWHLLIDSIISFSETPLVAIFYLGLAIFTLASLVGVALVCWKFFLGQEVSGWVSVMLSVWFLGGLTIFSLGTIGIYIAKIFIETKHRPYTIIRRVHGRSYDQPLLANRREHDAAPLHGPGSESQDVEPKRAR